MPLSQYPHILYPCFIAMTCTSSVDYKIDPKLEPCRTPILSREKGDKGLFFTLVLKDLNIVFLCIDFKTLELYEF